MLEARQNTQYNAIQEEHNIIEQHGRAGGAREDMRKNANQAHKLARSKTKYTIKYIPLISRVRGPYGKLWTEFFPSFYGPSAERAGHENKEGKNKDP